MKKFATKHINVCFLAQNKQQESRNRILRLTVGIGARAWLHTHRLLLFVLGNEERNLLGQTNSEAAFWRCCRCSGALFFPASSPTSYFAFFWHPKFRQTTSTGCLSEYSPMTTHLGTVRSAWQCPHWMWLNRRPNCTLFGTIPSPDRIVTSKLASVTLHGVCVHHFQTVFFSPLFSNGTYKQFSTVLNTSVWKSLCDSNGHTCCHTG